MTDCFEGKVAAITGAASGIGLACARKLLDEGATVVLIDRAEDRLRALCSELGERCRMLVVNLLNGQEVSGIFRAFWLKPDGSIFSMPMRARISAVLSQKAIPTAGTGCSI